MILLKKAGIAVLATTLFYSCHTDEPEINPEQLILGSWTETNAREVYTDFQNSFNSTQIDLTDATYHLVFNEDFTFSMFSNAEKLDSGSYSFKLIEHEEKLVTTSADNIRIPKPFDFERKLSVYKIGELKNTKLVLRVLLTESTSGPDVLSRREFIWELTR